MEEKEEEEKSRGRQAYTSCELYAGNRLLQVFEIPTALHLDVMISDV